MRVAITGAAPHGDLHRLVSEWATLFGSGLGYSRLMRFEAGPGTALPSLRVECDLCDDWRLVDSKTYEFDIDPEARWQDAEDFASRPVTPQDVVFSLERLREPASPHKSLLVAVDVIEPVGEGTVRFKLHFPDPELPLKLASPYAVVMAPDAISSVRVRTGRVVGSGPWRFEQGQSGQVTLAAWEGYFRDGEPVLDGVVFLPAADLETGVALLRAGRVDMAQVTEQQWGELSGEGFESVVLDRQGRGVLFGINAATATFDDLRVRRAIFAALDPETALAGSFGIGRVTTGVPVIDSSWQLDDALVRSVFDDVAGAAALLRDAGVQPPSFRLSVANFGEKYVAHGELLAAQLRAAGFGVTTEVVSRRSYLARVWEHPRDFELFVGPMPPTDTPSAFMEALLHTKGSSNVTGAGSAELDTLIEQQEVELDPVRRAIAIREIQALALDGAWLFMAAASAERWAYSERVVDPPMAFPFGGGDWWKYAGVND